MPKAIKLTDTAAITAAIEAAEGRAQVRCLDADDLTTAAAHAEKHLTDAGIPKKLWQGVVVDVNPHSVPNSYNNGMSAQSTQAKIVRRSTDWALAEVTRGYCHKASYGAGRPLATKITLPLPKDEITPLVTSMLTHHGITAAPIATAPIATADAAKVA